MLTAIQGFRMLVGDPNMRSRPDKTLQRQNCYRCYTGPNFGGDVSAPCQDSKSVPWSVSWYSNTNTIEESIQRHSRPSLVQVVSAPTFISQRTYAPYMIFAHRGAKRCTIDAGTARTS